MHCIYTIIHENLRIFQEVVGTESTNTFHNCSAMDLTLRLKRSRNVNSRLFVTFFFFFNLFLNFYYFEPDTIEFFYINKNIPMIFVNLQYLIQLKTSMFLSLISVQKAISRKRITITYIKTESSDSKIILLLNR